MGCSASMVKEDYNYQKSIKKDTSSEIEIKQLPNNKIMHKKSFFKIYIQKMTILFLIK